MYKGNMIPGKSSLANRTMSFFNYLTNLSKSKRREHS